MFTRDWIKIFYNVRKLKSKAWNKRTQNWIVVMEVIACGSTKAKQMCLQIGCDPYAYDFPFRDKTQNR